MNLEQELKQNNLRVTKARLALLGVLKNSEQPLTLDEINQELIKQEVVVNLSTIYRILEQFENSRILLKSTPMKPFQPLYEYRDGVHSHHLICERCGSIQLIENCPLETYEEKIAKKYNYEILSHRFELYGLCSNCQKEIRV